MSQPAPPRDFVRRLLVAVVVGAIVSVVSYLSAFYFLRAAFVFHSIAWMTRQDLKMLVVEIEAHKEQKGHYPARLTDIEGLKGVLKHHNEGQLVDPWGHLYQYSVTEDSFTLFSFGQDDQPGGEGDNADVYHDRPLELPTLHGFTFELPTEPIRWACVLTGVGAAVIAGYPTREGVLGLLIRAVVTTIGAILVAFLISIIHIPSGH